MQLTSDDCTRGFDVDTADCRLDDSCSPAADTDDGYLTPVVDDGDNGAVDCVDVLAATENNSSMRSKSSWNSLNSRSPVVQTLLRPRTRLAGIFDHAQRRNLGRGGSCVHGVIGGCRTADGWYPGLHGVAKNAGNGGGTKTILAVDTS